jgi:hypothetical protein
MPKQIQSDELDSVLRVVASFRSGVAFEKIAEALEPRLSRRTLQRRLARLVSQKRLLLNFALGTGQISKRSVQGRAQLGGCRERLEGSPHQARAHFVSNFVQTGVKW